MKDKLRTVEQGADTLVWLAVAKAAVEDPKNQGGQFFQVTNQLLSDQGFQEAHDAKIKAVNQLLGVS